MIYCDLRGIKEIPDGNRFLIFTLFPKGNIQVKVAHDSQRANTTAISVGYNIFNPTSNVNVGELLKNYGGGGHKVVGSSRVPNDQAEQAIKEIVAAVTEVGLNRRISRKERKPQKIRNCQGEWHSSSSTLVTRLGNENHQNQLSP